jgi:hypothetical protein
VIERLGKIGHLDRAAVHGARIAELGDHTPMDEVIAPRGKKPLCGQDGGGFGNVMAPHHRDYAAQGKGEHLGPGHALRTGLGPGRKKAASQDEGGPDRKSGGGQHLKYRNQRVDRYGGGKDAEHPGRRRRHVCCIDGTQQQETRPHDHPREERHGADRCRYRYRSTHPEQARQRRHRHE